MARESRNDKRVVRHQRIRKFVSGTPEKPRLCVFRSNKNIAAQIIDDVNGVTLVSASTIDKALKEEIKQELAPQNVSAKTIPVYSEKDGKKQKKEKKDKKDKKEKKEK